MRCFVGLLLACVIASPVLADEPAEASQWQSLFDGKSLEGWHANFDPEAFTIEDGAIRVQALSDRAAHLFYVGDNDKEPVKFKNFELKLVSRAEPNANSGVFLHTSTKLRTKWRLLDQGYEVQLNNRPEQQKTGSLYAVEPVEETGIDESEWFEMLIRVKDKQITVSLDGKQVLDYTEPEDPKRSADRKGRVFSDEGGAIALQAHDSNSVWYFKEIAIRPLD
ncbi:3-keto-disaccharide hydrolase [Aeoliella mucimassa]|uniref:3-keto-alpha-glucoside-1,2-lyase/3-keto-2-hydroxy-glucal hydratase domain-containing protein n=1 Tax=Aeoliella mucimassa TaxID=2527972 RepID=A0A518AKI5_9BACT|nr:DUF1080 domain-containing protein [Aeoliella mucimassa]QDU55248.1 hypothetical protein Pan181_14340 [Aeoliella mucimassa]